MHKSLILLSLLLSTLLFSCKKQEETLKIPQISDYAPLQTGKYIVYNLDSLVILNFGKKDTTISYQVKYLIDSMIIDNLNRPAYRVFRFIRKTPADNWVTDNTFQYTNTGNTLEFTENNLRFIKLSLPIRNDFSWKGNTFIDTYSLLSDVKYMDDWDYTYQNVNTPLTLGTVSLDNTITVSQRDEIIGTPSDPNSYSETNYSLEQYAAGIGLVYKKFIHEEYQPPASSSGSGYFADGSYGITLTMVDHN